MGFRPSGRCGNCSHKIYGANVDEQGRHAPSGFDRWVDSEGSSTCTTAPHGFEEHIVGKPHRPDRLTRQMHPGLN